MEDTDSGQTRVAIIGGGLAGIYAARLLEAAGLEFELFEARDRLGGRILSVDETGRVSEDGFDLGPSWFWPSAQPRLAALVDNLHLTTFAQDNEGDVIIHRMSRETPWRYRPTHQEPQSMRLAGGTGALVKSITGNLPHSALHMDSRVEALTASNEHLILTIVRPDGSRYSLFAEQVIAALPPRILSTISFHPPVEPITMRRWQETATWMAPHAKFIAVYDRRFWKDAGLSGTAQSMAGPLVEIHDATTASGKAALLGFVGVSADVRSSIGETALMAACVHQLVTLFGPDAGRSRATLLKDWAADPYTATAQDRLPVGHPQSSGESWVTGTWQNRLILAGSETSDAEPGYLAGAVSAAERSVAEATRRLGVNAPN